MKDKNGGSAFPVSFAFAHGDENIFLSGGMTLRDYFAAKAIPSIISNCKGDTRLAGECKTDYFARIAYEVADAMLTAREAKA